jgi:hypothetical protein
MLDLRFLWSDCEEYGSLWFNTMQFGESPMFQRSISLPSSWQKDKPNCQIIEGRKYHTKTLM